MASAAMKDKISPSCLLTKIHGGESMIMLPFKGKPLGEDMWFEHRLLQFPHRNTGAGCLFDELLSAQTAVAEFASGFFRQRFTSAKRSSRNTDNLHSHFLFKG